MVSDQCNDVAAASNSQPPIGADDTGVSPTQMAPLARLQPSQTTFDTIPNLGDALAYAGCMGILSVTLLLKQFLGRNAALQEVLSQQKLPTASAC